ncbi:MAG: methyltransferase domain-containing protein [Acidobacteria bacterium]|nr:methyltransferase domain-containing protein [Acidobacteriota bacterium]
MGNWHSFWERAIVATSATMGVEWIHVQTRYGNLLRGLIQPGAHWLDIGCGRQLIPDWALPAAEQTQIVSRAAQIVGIDFDKAILDHPHLHHRVIASGYGLPFQSESFDLITANMVIEHIDDPAQLLSEVKRCLKPGGVFAFVTPNLDYYLTRIAAVVPQDLKNQIVWILERREADDVFPTHYKLNQPADIQQAATLSGFQIERLELVNSKGAFARLGPVGVAEVLLRWVLQRENFAKYRSNVMCQLRKPLGIT